MKIGDYHILMYHHVAPRGKMDYMRPWLVFQDEFSRQLDIILSLGYKTVYLDTLFDEIENKIKTEKHKIIITFDDCGTDLMDYAVPELRKRGLTATFFVPVGKLGGYNDWDNSGRWPKIPIMNEADIRFLIDNGFEIGSHGVHHIDMGRCSSEVALKELIESKQQLEDRFSIPIHFFAFPFGEYPKDYFSLCSKAGYRGACGISSPYKCITENPYAVRRVLVHTGDTALRFKLKMTKLYLWLLSARERRYHTKKSGNIQ
jgi:peptidoglycan/xylan/chitin deacetylase (PgdA/CDA1 family)